MTQKVASHACRSISKSKIINTKNRCIIYTIKRQVIIVSTLYYDYQVVIMYGGCHWICERKEKATNSFVWRYHAAPGNQYPYNSKILSQNRAE